MEEGEGWDCIILYLFEEILFWSIMGVYYRMLRGFAPFPTCFEGSRRAFFWAFLTITWALRGDRQDTHRFRETPDAVSRG